MGRQAVVALYVVVMVVIIVGVDVLFLKHQFWPRLAVNIGIVLAFGAGYFWLLKPRTGG
jgi:type IV secretory pathway VirB2 component (pilin)